MSAKVDFMAILKQWYTKFVKSIAVKQTFYVKFVIVLFIIIATFFNIGRHLKLLDNKLAKIFLLVAVVATLLFDLHTGIILLIAFMMLMIQFNSSIVDDINNKQIEMFLTSLPAPLQGTSTDNDNVIPQNPASIECDNIKKNEI
jgi:chromate transport protein ChrA